MYEKLTTNKKIDSQFNFSMDGISVATVLFVDVNRRLVTITTTEGKKLDVGLAETAGMEGDGSFFLPPSGKDWKALMSDKSGDPYIIGFLPPGSYFGNDDQLNKSTFSFGEDIDETYSITSTQNTYPSYKVDSGRTKKNYRNNKYYDLIPGDWGHTQIEGNMLGILRGGYNVLKATERAMLEQFQEDDLTRITSRNFELFTDFGIMKMENVGGKTRYVMRGNSGQNEEYDTWDKETYEWEMQIGACEAGGDNNTFFFTWEYKTPAKETVLFTIGTDGNVMLKVPRDFWQDVGEDSMNTVGQNYALFAGKDLTADAGQDVKISAGEEGTVGSDGHFTPSDGGKPWAINLIKNRTGEEGRAVLGKVGEMEVHVTDNNVLLGKLFGTPNSDNKIVLKPHLDDKYNPLCQALFDIFSSMATGDLGIPVPVMVRTGQVSKAIDLISSLKDNEHFTTETEAT